MAAEDDDVLLEGKLVGHALVKDLSIRGHVDDFVVMALRGELLDVVEHRFHHHHHAGVSAVRIVVHCEARPQAVFPQIVHVDLYQSLLDGAAGNGVAERAVQQLRHHGEDVYS